MSADKKTTNLDAILKEFQPLLETVSQDDLEALNFYASRKAEHVSEGRIDAANKTQERIDRLLENAKFEFRDRSEEALINVARRALVALIKLAAGAIAL